jgi:hypothetical protein
MPSPLKILKETLYKTDFFASTELLRFRGDADNKTLTGGFVSLAMIIAILVTFASMIITTINKVMITASVTNTADSDPSPLTLSTYGDYPFMFGV